MRRWAYLRFFGGFLASCATLFAATAPSGNRATGTGAASPPPANSAPAAPAGVILPPKPPPGVPDEANPFADEKSAPKPLKGSSRRERLTVDIHPEKFDGLAVMMLELKGPDFEWIFDPLADWVLAPAGPDESVAFVYQPNPAARFGLALYPAKDFLPTFTANSIAEYLAMVRGSNVKGFILMTPIPKDAGLLEPTSFGGFQVQSVRYATVIGTQILLHHDWFINLNNQYLLLATLTSPPALMDRFNSQVQFFLGRSNVRKGLGVRDPDAPPPPPAKAE